MTTPDSPPRVVLANAVRALSMDAVQKANSGHPGAPMGMADIAEVLWNDFLRHNPCNPKWPNRDRFIMSNGHGSMLLYALLHLSGYDLSLEDLQAFRQWHSKTPGHPEYNLTPGVETTTGPLGQGLANAVGMAIAEKVLAAEFNRPGFAIVDHHTYVTLGDGCMMEGISHEACSLAGTLGLGKLIAIYDDNGISIDGEVQGWLTDNTPQRFNAYGWHVVPAVDGHNAKAIAEALTAARSVTDRPSLICCKTVIGKGAPNKQGKASSHGAPLGPDEVAAARQALGWSHAPFVIPAEIYRAWDARPQGQVAEDEWNGLFGRYQAAFPELAAELERRVRGDLPAGWTAHADAAMNTTVEKAENIATRKASQNALNLFAPALPELLGGSADLAESNLTHWSKTKAVTAADAAGNYINYGVREFGMTAIMNGLALHGGFIPYAGTFLVFSDYARNAVRLAALMGIRSIYVYTHDSIGLGEDGPTHQPVEHAASLRLIPNLSLWRPCDAIETVAGWRAALERRQGPTALLLSRQALAPQPRTAEQLRNIQRGGYILLDAAGTPDCILIATGSEVALAMAAAAELRAAGRSISVVSMPSTDLFDAQDSAYRNTVLPPSVRCRIAVEAAAADYWTKYTGLDGRVIGLTRFGESAPGPTVMERLGFTVDNIVAAANELISSH